MSEKQIQKMIRSVAEEKAPGETIQLWSRIKSQLRSFEAKPQRHWPSHLRLAGTALGLAILLAGVVFILSPQGQAWAQEAFQFFTKTESDRVPFEVFQATQSAGSAAATPTTESEPTPTPGSLANGMLTLEEVQDAAGFVPYEPSWLPEDFEFAGASYDEGTKVVTMMYTRLGNIANSFSLRQEPYRYLADCDICTSVGTSADIKKVSIHGVYGEYVEGVWAGDDGDAVWENTPYLKRMIWRENGMAFQIVYNGFPAYMLEKDFIAVAESVTSNRQIVDYLTVDEAESLAGFPIAQPTWLPDNFEFEKAVYDLERNIVTLMYYYGGNINNALGLKLEPRSDQGTCYLCSIVGTSARVQSVSINGVEGEYVEGVWTLDDGAAVWKSYSYYTVMKRLIWQTDEMTFELSYMGNTLVKKDIIAVAESVR